jgi:hypothetical protein
MLEEGEQGVVVLLNFLSVAALRVVYCIDIGINEKWMDMYI